MLGLRDNTKRETDALLVEIADYVIDYPINRDEAYQTARYVLIDSIGTAVLALRYPECAKLLGPLVPGTVVPYGVRGPGKIGRAP